MSAEILLSARDISYTRANRLLLDSISFDLERAQITTIIGPNGAGKSTLVGIVTGLVRGFEGRLERSESLRIGYLPQQVNVNKLMPLTVERMLRLTRHPGDDEIDRALEQTHVAKLRYRQVRSLSEGELKRVLLARAALGSPDLVVLDEPTSGVDVSGEIRMYQLIGELRDSLNCAILMVSHDLHLVMSQTDQVLCLNRHLCCSGKPESVRRHSEYLALFGSQAAESIAVYTHDHDHEHHLDGDLAGHADHGHG